MPLLPVAGVRPFTSTAAAALAAVRPRRRLRKPHADFSKMFTPAGLLYMGGAAVCLYISYQFSTRIGEPNSRVERRKQNLKQQQEIWKQRRAAREAAGVAKSEPSE